MSTATTPIQWTDKTWNPVRGCSRVSTGCDSCYAMGQAHRFAGPGQPYEGLTTIRKGKVDWSGEARFIPSALAEPLSWRKPQRVFVNSMSDLFHHSVTNEEIAAVFGVMAACPHLTFQVLTKRAERMREWFAWANEARGLAGGDGEVRRCMGLAFTKGATWTRHVEYPVWPLPNVHLGVSCEDQQRADERIPHLIQTPAAVRFVSAEPLLGRIDLDAIQIPGAREGLRCSALRRAHDDRFGSSDILLDWVIVGGESGTGARPCNAEDIRSIVRQCTEAGVPVFVKQLGRFAYSDKGGRSFAEDLRGQDRKGGDPAEWPEDLRVRQFPEARP